VSEPPLILEQGTERSRALFDRLARVMPGANTRSATYFAPFPLTLVRGEGPFVWDLDGNRLIDLVNNYTSLVHGHAHPSITEAIVRHARTGTVFPAPILPQLELAERITSRLASVEQVRFTNSGTEAAMHAVRCARSATGRDAIVKANVGYHGSWEGTPGSPGERGIPAGVARTIHWVDYNAADQLEEVMERHGHEVAAIILEPVLGAGVIPGEPGFFAAARRASKRAGALLILDEVVTLRLEHAGYQSRLGITPDLTVLGKVIGGGLPVGGFGGPEELMRLYDPRRQDGIEHHGTFNGNALAMAAGVASLDLLGPEEIQRINRLGALLADGLRKHSAAREGIEITRDGSLVQIHFEVDRIPRSGADLNPRSEQLRRFHLAALARGVYVAPRGELNVTTVMDERLVEEAVQRLGDALASV